MYFQQILHLASGNGLSLKRKQCFLIRAIFLLVEAIIGIRGEVVFKERAYHYYSGQLIFWLVVTIFFSFFRDDIDFFSV